MIQTDIGLYGNTAHATLLATDAMAAHFVMKTQVVRTALDRGGTYHVPCTSSNLFSLLFDPKNNIIEAMNGFYFESVSDMMLHTPLPPAIKAVRSFQGSSIEFSVQEGDVLLVSRRIKSRGVPKRKYISCYKAATGEKKRLYEGCTAGFTTRPEDVQLSLSELLNSRYSPLPLKAVMYYIGPSQDSPQVSHYLVMGGACIVGGWGWAAGWVGGWGCIALLVELQCTAQFVGGAGLLGGWVGLHYTACLVGEQGCIARWVILHCRWVGRATLIG